MNSPLAIYIHWPFCVSKCPYCDFNSYPGLGLDEGRMKAALVSELEHFANETGPRTVSSIFFGGGTPSLMTPQTISDLIEAVKRLWGLADDPEITMEANPTSAESDSFQGFGEAGVNRLSLGVQSFDDRSLAFLGRLHSASEAVSALELAARHFPRISFDLIYGLPGQGLEHWQRELKSALNYVEGHVSLYQLSVEPGTGFHKSGIREVDQDMAARLYETSLSLLEENGLTAYEISNFAVTGEECRHNLRVWRGADYVGAGPGAHGRITTNRGTVAASQTADPESWLEMAENCGHGTAERKTLSPAERLEEILMLGLRLAEGIGRARFLELTGYELEEAFDGERLRALTDGGFLVLDESGLRATGAGRLRLDAVLAALLA
ncbi:MAG: radical SAM family heme chaperone HemW [Rhodospirillales bacterium]